MAKEISPFMSLAFCFASIGATASVIAYFDFAMKTGGPAVIIWGWIAVSAILLITGNYYNKIIKNLQN